MALGIVSFSGDDKRLLFVLLQAILLSSFLLQVIGLSTSVWVCEDESFRCKNIYELDSVTKDLLIPSFTLKCLTVLWLIVYFIYKYRYSPEEAWNYPINKHAFVWRVWAVALTESEILSATVFIYTSMKYNGISWSAYLYSFLGFFLTVSACILTVLRAMHFILEALDPHIGAGYFNVEEDTHDEECRICMERRVDVILPCRHRLCRTCAFRIQNEIESLCPFCRSHFMNFYNIT